MTDPFDPRLDAGRRILDVPRAQQRRLVALAVGRTVLISAALVIGYHLIPFDDGETWQISIVAAAALVLILAVAGIQLRAVSLAAFPGVRAVQALAVSLIVLIVAFSGVYMILCSSDPSAFDEVLDHTSALYFSMTTLTTLGYGDIVPVSDAARYVVMLQMVIDVLLIGVFLKLITNTVRVRLEHDRAGGSQGSGVDS